MMSQKEQYILTKNILNLILKLLNKGVKAIDLLRTINYD